MRLPLRILVVDDHPIVRRNVCSLLRAESDFDVVCDVADGLQAVDKAAEIQPDVVVLDITMPHLDGFEAARRIRRVAPSAEILFLSQLGTTETIRQAFSCGARGYVDQPPSEIADFGALPLSYWITPRWALRFSGSRGGRSLA